MNKKNCFGDHLLTFKSASPSEGSQRAFQTLPKGLSIIHRNYLSHKCNTSTFGEKCCKNLREHNTAEQLGNTWQGQLEKQLKQGLLHCGGNKVKTVGY